jgi:hypothetical protein
VYRVLRNDSTLGPRWDNSRPDASGNARQFIGSAENVCVSSFTSMPEQKRHGLRKSGRTVPQMATHFQLRRVAELQRNR